MWNSITDYFYPEDLQRAKFTEEKEQKEDPNELIWEALEYIKELQRSNLIIEQDTAPEADIEPGMGKVSRKSFSREDDLVSGSGMP